MPKTFKLIAICTFLLQLILLNAKENANARNFVLYTQPKTGTYLLTPILEKMTGRKQKWVGYNIDISQEIQDLHTFNISLKSKSFVPVYLHHNLVPCSVYSTSLDKAINRNEFLACHTPYSKTLEKLLIKKNTLVFHILRDPRDFIISGAHFYGKGNQCIFPIEWYQQLSFDKKIFWMIKGTNWHNSTRWFLDIFSGWTSSSNCCVVNFDKLLGPYGGNAASEEQIFELRKIASALEINLSDEELLDIFIQCYAKGPTYKDGIVGKWRDFFNEEHKKLCKSLFGDFLISYGFEENNEW